jgi:hypothetical protein
VLLARGLPLEALAEVREALALITSLGKIDEGEALVRVAHAEALRDRRSPGGLRRDRRRA